MISITSLTVAYGGFTLLDDINFHISESDKIGLVGKNGAGKSTILKLICGEQTPTSGKISISGGVSIGYLPQIMSHNKGRSVIDETMTAFDELLEKQKLLESISNELASRTDYESKEYSDLIVKMNEVNDSINATSTISPRAMAEKTLLGLGFKSDELSRPTETFSQGWNMRIELAKILLKNPGILLLDEPTNHLDIESIEWFEAYLKDYKGSVLLISHDRKFLDTVTNRTVEIMLGHIHDYKVPYSKYRLLREERISQQVAAFQNQQKMIEKTTEFIEKFRYKPTKSNQVQSRIKALEKLERIDVDVEERAAMNIKFPPAPRSGDVTFKAVDLSAGYPQKVVFNGAQVEVKRGEKVAFVGRNGEGKTTLMRVIMGQLEPLEGSATIGHNVHIGYYAQNQEDVLDKSATVYETLDRIAVGDIRTRLRDILACFLFKGEDIDKKVAVLSGGERARLAMAKLMLENYNLLALDEPTNHMDIISKDLLKQALQSYDGTIIIVSHDRDFLDGLVDKVYEFRDGKVKEYLGGIQDFLDHRHLESLGEVERKSPSSQESKPASTASKTAPKTSKSESAPAPQRKIETKEDKRKRIARERLEKEIEELEKKAKEMEAVLSAPGEGVDVMDITRDYMENQIKLDYKMKEWEKLI